MVAAGLEDLGERRIAAATPGAFLHHHVPHRRRQAGSQLREHIDLLAPPVGDIGGEDELSLAVFEPNPYGLLAEAAEKRDDDAAGSDCSKHDGDYLGHHRHEDSHAVSLLEPVSLQPAGDRLGFVEHLRVAPDDGRPVLSLPFNKGARRVLELIRYVDLTADEPLGPLDPSREVQHLPVLLVPSEPQHLPLERAPELLGSIESEREEVVEPLEAVGGYVPGHVGLLEVVPLRRPYIHTFTIFGV